MWLAVWVTAFMLCSGGGAHPQFTFAEQKNIQPVHRVQQHSSQGVQKIRVGSETTAGVTVLPLSIDSKYGSGNQDRGSALRQEQVRDTLSKRQTNPTKSQSTATATATTTATATATSRESGHLPHTGPPQVRKIAQNAAASTEPKKEERRDGDGEGEDVEKAQKSNSEPQSGKYGIGNTLVLLVSGNDNNQPSYVDQTQPHKVAEPLKYEPSPRRSEPRISGSTSAEKSLQDAPRPEPLAQKAKEVERRKETYIPVSQKYEKEPVLVQQDYYQQPKEQFYDSEHTVPQPKPYIETYEAESRPAYENGRNPISQLNTYEPVRSSRTEVYQQDGKVDRKTENDRISPQDQYESDRNGAVRKPDPYKIINTPNRKPMGEYEQEESQKEYETGPHPVKISRPSNLDSVKTTTVNRPAEDTASYIELRPTYTQQSMISNTQASSDYSGFPESHQPNRNGGISRPLQYEPPRVFPPSPCHSVFQYEGREPNVDFWNGDLYVSTEEILIGIRLDIILDRPARLLANWLAEAKTKDNIQYTILSLNKRLVPGPAETVKITVRFHSDGPVPYLQSIILNGRRICPNHKTPNSVAIQRTTTRPIFENPGDFIAKTTTTTTESYREQVYEERPVPARATTQRYLPNDRRTTTEKYRQTARPDIETYERPDPNPNYYEDNDKNRAPTPRPTKVQQKPYKQEVIACGKPAVQPRPLVTYGQLTSRGQWPWHAAIYKSVGVDLSYICGGSLISARHVVTAAHCVTTDFKPVDASALVVYLGKYHLRLWSEGGVQNKQVTEVEVNESYNKTAYRADLAVLILSSPVEFTEFIRPVCLWDRNKADIADVENQVGVVVGWGFDESRQLTEELMQGHMPIVKHDECLWSYPEFFPKFTSNLTYCAGFRNGTSVCNGDSGGGMVFPRKVAGEERWFLRGLVSISVAEKDNRVCDTKHYVVFTDLAQFLPWLEKFV